MFFLNFSSVSVIPKTIPKSFLGQEKFLSALAFLMLPTKKSSPLKLILMIIILTQGSKLKMKEIYLNKNNDARI